MRKVRRMRKKRDKKNSYKAFWIILTIGFLWVSFNKAGVVKWVSLYYQKQSVLHKIAELTEKETSIKEHNNKLENDMSYIEFLAYSKYKMVKPGEKIFRIQDTKSVKNEPLGK